MNRPAPISNRDRENHLKPVLGLRELATMLEKAEAAGRNRCGDYAVENFYLGSDCVLAINHDGESTSVNGETGTQNASR